MNEIVAVRDKRFTIHPESLERFKSLRERFTLLQNKYPYVSGLGFFGSRTKGTETDTSDFDICIFYNSERITTTELGTPAEWSVIIDELQATLDTAIDHRIHSPSDGLRIDISTAHTISTLEMFIEAVENASSLTTDETTILESIDTPAVRDLCARFFLAVGDELYANRILVLDHLQALPDGDKYLRLLMKSLANFEQFNKKDPAQTTNRTESYPTTFEEVRAKFRL